MIINERNFQIPSNSDKAIDFTKFQFFFCVCDMMYRHAVETFSESPTLILGALRGRYTQSETYRTIFCGYFFSTIVFKSSFYISFKKKKNSKISQQLSCIFSKVYLSSVNLPFVFIITLQNKFISNMFPTRTFYFVVFICHIFKLLL